MPKLKMINRNSQIFVKCRLSRAEEIEERELQIFNTKLIQGLVRPVVDGKKTINYVIHNGISLRKYLQKGITKNEFFLVIAQVVRVTEKIKQYDLNINNLVLDLQYSFINEKTKGIWLIYQPIKNARIISDIYINTYLRDIVFGSEFHLYENTQSINEFLSFLYQEDSYSAEEIDRYIMRECPEIHKQIWKDSQRFDNKKWNEKSKDDMHLTGEETGLLDEENETTLLDEEGTTLLGEEETTLLEDDGEGTTLLNRNQVIQAYLFRISNFDRINIDKAVFRIGKEKSYVDYFVANNNAVSRVHADIIKEDDSYFLQDNNSTNHTFVNGVMIKANQKKELFDGDAIMLANEAFEFHISEEYL